MHRRLLRRALIGLVAPAVTVVALAGPATAAAQVPTLDEAATVYAHLENGTSSESSGKVYGPGKKCKPGKAIKGATARSASYSPDYTSGDPSAYVIDGERPMVSVTAMEFPNTKAAITYLRGSNQSTKDCGGGGGSGGGGGGQTNCKAKMKKIKFALGDERYGYQIRSTCKVAGHTVSSVMNTLFVRQGKHIVYTTMISMDTSAPSIPKSIDFTDLALDKV